MSVEWSLVRLEDVTTIIGDGLHGTPEYDEFGEYHFINGNNLQNGKIVITESTKKSSEHEYLRHKKNLNNRTILVSINGTLGNVAIYEGEKVFLGKSACYLNVDESVDKYFVRYVISSNIFQDYIHSLATGSTIKNVSLKLMRNFEFYLPSLNEQQKISGILKSLDDKITLNRQINQTLEAMAQALFKSWFVDFEPVKAKLSALAVGGSADDANLAAMSAISGKTTEQLLTLKTTHPDQFQQLYTTADLFPSEMVDSELSEIPKGWEVVGFEKIAQPKKGKNITKSTVIEGDVPVVAGGLEPAYYHNTPNVFSPVITVSASGANAGYVNLYHNDIWASDCSYISKGQTSYVYSVYCFLKLKQKEIYDMQQGAAQPHVYPKDLHRLKLASPESLTLWLKLEELVMPFFSMIKSHIQETHSLTQSRDTLLPKLLAGELLVDELEDAD